MKTMLIKNGRKWSLYSALVAAMVYAALTLHSEPAYAQTCTQQECQNFSEACVAYCAGAFGGVLAFQCPWRPTAAQCTCKDGERAIWTC
jgi:hypothetical protein